MALYYLRELGWNVFPVEPHGKKPLVKWEEYQTKRVTDTLVHEWWYKWPNANIAAALGPVSNCSVLDIDAWDGKTLPFPDAWTDETGRGIHQAFLHQKGVPANKIVVEVAGFKCEWLTKGQYRILPKSVHPSGKVYRHIGGTLDFVPDTLLALLRSKDRGSEVEAHTEAPRGSEGGFKLYYEGGRDNMLAELCGRWIRKGLVGHDVWNMLAGINLRQCVPPLPASDIERIFKSITKQEAENHPQAYRIGAVRMSEVTAEPVHWLWKPWLPEGQISIIEGDQGIGKSTLVLDIAARVSVGAEMPGGAGPCKQGCVLIATSEDIASVVKGRLELAGASMEHILFLRDITDIGGERPLRIPDDVSLLEQYFQKFGVKLFLLDPWEAFLSDKVDSLKNQSVRTALHPLCLAADRTRCTPLLFRHLTKATGVAVQHRGQGSVGVGAVARSIMLVTKDPNGPEGSLILSQHKSSLARGVATSLTLRLVDEGDYARVEWTGHSPLTAEQAAAGKIVTEGSAEVRRGIQVLRSVLADGPKLSREVREAMAEADVSERNEKRAREIVRVKSRKTKEGWIVSLPEVEVPEVDMES